MFKLDEKTIDAYKEKVKAQIKEMRAQMQMVEARAEKAGADTRIKYQKNMDEWKKRFSDLEKELDEFSKSAEDTWDEIRSGIDTSMNDLRESIENATKQLGK